MTDDASLIVATTALDDAALVGLVEVYDDTAWPPLAFATPFVALLGGALLGYDALGPRPSVVLAVIPVLAAFAWSATRRKRFIADCASRRVDPALAGAIFDRLSTARGPRDARAQALRAP